MRATSTTTPTMRLVLDGPYFARRAVVVLASGAGLLGILAGRPVLSVAWRSAAVLCVGLCAIHVAEIVTARVRASTLRSRRGGER